MEQQSPGMARLAAGADGSFAALDAVYAREGGSGILELGGAADARIVVWAMVRGLRLAEFKERKQEAMASSAVISAFRYLHTGLAPRIIGELLGPSDRRVMRIVSSKWRAQLDKSGWRAEEARQEERIVKLAAGITDLTRLLGGGNWIYRFLYGDWGYGLGRPLGGTRAVVYRTVKERIRSLRDEVEVALAEYAGGRAALVTGLLRSLEKVGGAGPAGTAKGSGGPQEAPSSVSAFIGDTWWRLSRRGLASRMGPHCGCIDASGVGSSEEAPTLAEEVVGVRERLAATRRQVEELQEQVVQQNRQLAQANEPMDAADHWFYASTNNLLVRAQRSLQSLEEEERRIAQMEALVDVEVQKVLDAACSCSSERVAND